MQETVRDRVVLDTNNEMALAKEAAELELMRAQIAELQERAKPTGQLRKATELIKVVGSVVLGLLGFSVALTGYQINALKSERLELEMAKETAKLEAVRAESMRLQKDTFAQAKVVDELSRNLQAAFASLPTNTTAVALNNLYALQKEGPLPGPSTQRLRNAIQALEGGLHGDDTRQIEFERVKNEMQKLSQMEQAMSKIMDAIDQIARDAIRSIKAG